MQSDLMKVAFLDRDGVINKEVNYLCCISKFEYTSNCLLGLRMLRELGYQIIVITNQAGIAKGYYSENDYNVLTKWYLSDLKANGIEVLAVYHCPHHSEGVVQDLSMDCLCRKPEPGMLQKAAKDFRIDINDSILIGDKESDLIAGERFGLRHKNLFGVGTGHPFLSRDKYLIFRDILAVARHVGSS